MEVNYNTPGGISRRNPGLTPAGRRPGPRPGNAAARVDTENQPALAGAAQITSIPTLMAFRDGILVFSQPGAFPAVALEQVIRTARDLDMDDILGARSPPFAHQALSIDRSIGLLLPCNVVVRAADGGTVVEALDPQVMITLTGRPELTPVADEVSRRLAAALAELAR